ncbi:MAG: tetrahydrofolate dehydrogenase/cyclohydrolase catalytic domain-containing protein [bacterium]
MSARIIDGKQIAGEIKKEIAQEAEELKGKGITPGLVTILVGEDPASQTYVGMKRRTCAELGMKSVAEEHPADLSEEDLLGLIDKYNADPEIHGILVQLPLPDHIDEKKVLLAIDPGKDVDGFHPNNVGLMMIGEARFAPCTPAGIVELLMRSDNPPSGKEVVIVGRSNIVGKPVANLLVQKNDRANATVTVCHSRTKDLPGVVKRADIVIAAIGSAEFIKADWLKPGAVVIDVGTNRVDDESRERGWRLVGDVDFEAAKEVASAITPVPGGVGPMTITMLMWNTMLAAKQQNGMA